jgi:transmembrane sensor
MTKMSKPRGDIVPPERLAEAGVWIARLHGGELDKAAVAGVKQWLKADPMNERALELCTEMWEESANLRRVVPFETEKNPPISRRYVGISLAAAAILLTLGFAFWFAQTPDIATDVGEQRLVTLKDGTRVFLNTNTRIAVRYDARARSVELKKGEALFDVAKRPTWPFVVEAGDREIRALGTSFVVRRDDMQTAVILVEGTVTVTAPPPLQVEASPRASMKEPQGRETFTLTPGQKLTFVAAQSRLDNTSLDNATAWRRGQIILDDTPLSAAISELNRYSKVKLVVKRPEAQAIRVTGLFRTGDSLSFAHAVAQTYGLTVDERDDAIVLGGIPTLGAADPR